MNQLYTPDSHRRLIDSSRKGTVVEPSNFKKPISESNLSTFHEKEDFTKVREASIATSHRSRVSGQKKVSKAFTQSLSMKFYSPYFKGVCLFCYVLLLAIGLMRTYIKFELDAITKGLDVKKDILVSAQMRTFYLSNVETIFRQVYDLKTGRQTLDDLGSVKRTLPEYVGIAAMYLDKLFEINKEILLTTYYLDQETQEILFEPDVKMYDTTEAGNVTANSFLQLNSFQGSEKIVDIGLKLLGKDDWRTEESEQEFDYMVRNCMNDIYLRNNGISAMLLELGQAQIERFRTILFIFLSLQITLFTFLTCTFTVFVWKKYFMEKTNINVLLKLKNSQIQSTLMKASKFKRLLKEEKSFEKLRNDDSFSEVFHTNSHINVERNINRSPKFSGMRIRYLKHTLQGIFFIVIMAGLVSWSFSIGFKNIGTYHDKILILNFASTMTSRVNIATITAAELPIRDPSTLILNLPVPEAMEEVIKDIMLLRTETTTNLVESSLIQNNEIKQILNEDGCPLLDEHQYQRFCNVLEEKGISKNVIGMLSTLEIILKDINEQFQKFKNDATALKAMEKAFYGEVLSLKRVLVGETLLIADLVNQEFLDYNTKTQSTRNDMWALFFVIWIALLILFWVQIFRKLKEINNDFKKILQTIPIEVVLSSFLLKNFLVKSSKGTLDSVKNVI